LLDQFDRSCLFYDFEVLTSPRDGGLMEFARFADDIIARSKAGLAFKLVDKVQKIARVSDAKREVLKDGSPALALVVTFGDRRGADPAFVNFATGGVRPIARGDGEAKGYSAHILFRLQPYDDRPTRYGALIEEVPSVGRTILERLLNSEFAAIAEEKGLHFRREGAKNDIKARPYSFLSGRKSEQFDRALGGGQFSPVELIDTRLVQTGMDEAPGVKVKSRHLTVKITPQPGEAMRAALERLQGIAARAGYDHMRVRWREGADKRLESALLPTALRDIGEALYVKRETVRVTRALTECDPTIRPDLLSAMISIFA